MERRREVRIRTDKPVEVTVLGSNQSSSPAQAVEFSGHGLQLVLPQPLPVSAPVKIEGDDWMMLGEVCYCRQEGIHFVAGLKIDQTLENLQELADLNEHLLQTECKREDVEADTERSNVGARR